MSATTWGPGPCKGVPYPVDSGDVGDEMVALDGGGRERQAALIASPPSHPLPSGSQGPADALAKEGVG